MGQDGKDYYCYLVDSLDMIHPHMFKRMKSRGDTFVIKVNSQEQFDRINEEITNAINAGEKNIIVRIAKGVYHFHECHIIRKNEDASDVSISIEGKKTVITSTDNDNLTNEPNNPWLEMVRMDTLVKVLDEDQKLCFIPYKNTFSDEERTNLKKIQITQWYQAPIYSVSEINNEGIYFIATNLNYEKGWYKYEGYNVNFDYLYYGVLPRFRLYDITKAPNCSASRFVDLENCKYRMFNICDIQFVGNRSGKALIGMSKVNAQQILIQDCTFDHIRGNVANFNGTGNVLFDSNVIQNTDGNEVRFVNNCPNVRVTNNMFHNCALANGQTFCVTCWESTYYIANNTFSNFGYAAIGLGVWHGFEKKYPSSGIVEHNEVYFTTDYLFDSWKHMLMDSGAIYTWTQNDNVIIRYNYIHDYIGAGDNRGIFCDDGSANIKIYGNVILNIPNSYNIDCRMTRDQKNGLFNNSNNFMAQNVLDGSVRFMGYADEERHAIKGTNFIMKKDVDRPFENKFANLEIMVNDLEVESITISDTWFKKKCKKRR